MRNMVSTPDQVAANIRRFEEELPRVPALQATLGQVHSWYALRLDSGDWIFGPSKFVGYRDNTAKRYVETFRKVPDGGRPEMALTSLSSPVDLESRLGGDLLDALTEYLERWGRTPRRGVRISVVSEEVRRAPTSQASEQTLHSRISINPRVAGGRPCIKGTRMRVSDIVDMLAAGASHAEILEDYPYLVEEDITAALAYAARATDHRVIRAA